MRAGDEVQSDVDDGAASESVFQTLGGLFEVVELGESTVNRIPVVNDEERKTYGAPVTEVESPRVVGGKTKALIDDDGFVKNTTLKNTPKKKAPAKLATKRKK